MAAIKTKPEIEQEIIEARKWIPEVGIGRLHRLQEQMKSRDIGAMILFDPVNINYAYRPQIRKLDHLHPYLKSVFEKNEAKYLALDVLRVQHEKIFNQLGYKLMEALPSLDQARVIKLPGEIKIMKAACSAVKDCCRMIKDNLRPGITENELWSLYHQMNIAYDGQYLEARNFVAGERTNPWMQFECGPEPIKAGDLVALDTDCCGPFGYYVDISRTWICPDQSGECHVTDDQKRLYQAAYDQIKHNISILRPGMTFREFAEKAWPIPDKYWEQRYFTTLHGVGMGNEWPYIQHIQLFDLIGYDGVIEPGMVLAIESYIGEKGGKEGVKLEEQVLITDNGVEQMSADLEFEELLLFHK